MAVDQKQSVAGSSKDKSLVLPSHWIIGPKQDLILFLGTPFILISLVMIAKTFWTITAFSVFATVLAMGHYLPGMMRAYGDPTLFRRFPVRFGLAPIFFLTVSIWMSYYERHAFLLVVIVWGAWHWLMQTYGLVRIYDAKAKNFDDLSARYDYALCISWFGVLYWYTEGSVGMLARFYQAGGWLAPMIVRWGATIWLAATVGVSIGYLIHIVRRYRNGHQPSLLKFALLIVTFFYYLYAFGYSSSKVVAYILFEGYHDIQYLAIVWIFNHNRATKDVSAGAFTRFLFRKRLPLILFYVALCIGFGSFDYFAKNVDMGRFDHACLGIITGFALVHFYFDGFIWRMRERDTSKTLNVENNAQQSNVKHWHPTFRHAMLWTVLLVPVLALAVWETKIRANLNEETELAELNVSKHNIEAFQKILEFHPNSHRAHYLLSEELKKIDRRDEALDHIRQARRLRPSYDVYDVLFADLLLQQDELSDEQLDEIIRCYERASETRTRNASLHHHWGLALMKRGRLDDALVQIKRSIELAPNTKSTPYFDLANLLVRRNNALGAANACEKAIAVNPENVGALGLLASLILPQNPELALQYFDKAVQQDPTRVLILMNYSQALATVADSQLRDETKAVQLAESAKAQEPENPDVFDHLAKLYAHLGQMDQAVSIAKQAADLYLKAGDSARATQMAQFAKSLQDGS